MSRIGKKPVKVPSGVKVELKGNQLSISGSADSLTLEMHPEVKVEYDAEAKEILVNRQGNQRLQRAMHGTTRALIQNMIEGVTKGFAKTLRIFGTGYGVEQKGQNLFVQVGFAKPASLPVPPGVHRAGHWLPSLLIAHVSRQPPANLKSLLLHHWVVPIS